MSVTIIHIISGGQFGKRKMAFVVYGKQTRELFDLIFMQSEKHLTVDIETLKIIRIGGIFF